MLTVTVLQGSLAVATQMLMSEEAYAVPGLRAALGRLANSVVAVLGPELSPGTDVYTKCKALIREIQVVLGPACCCHLQLCKSKDTIVCNGLTSGQPVLNDISLLIGTKLASRQYPYGM